jgi:hypothetical protein
MADVSHFCAAVHDEAAGTSVVGGGRQHRAGHDGHHRGFGAARLARRRAVLAAGGSSRPTRQRAPTSPTSKSSERAGCRGGGSSRGAGNARAQGAGQPRLRRRGARGLERGAAEGPAAAAAAVDLPLSSGRPGFPGPHRTLHPTPAACGPPSLLPRRYTAMYRLLHIKDAEPTFTEALLGKAMTALRAWHTKCVEVHVAPGHVNENVPKLHATARPSPGEWRPLVGGAAKGRAGGQAGRMRHKGHRSSWHNSHQPARHLPRPRPPTVCLAWPPACGARTTSTWGRRRARGRHASRWWRWPRRRVRTARQRGSTPPTTSRPRRRATTRSPTAARPSRSRCAGGSVMEAATAAAAGRCLGARAPAKTPRLPLAARGSPAPTLHHPAAPPPAAHPSGWSPAARRPPSRTR